MPPDRRRRRFRRPGTGRWLAETLPSLRIELASQVRATLTAWMRLYGEANNVPGLATGPIETRFARLRENTAAESLIVWTTPGRWAAGEGLSLRFPQLHLDFTCALGDGHLVANKVSQVPEDARAPDREPGAVGVVVHSQRVLLPPDDTDSFEPDAGVDILEQHFARLAGKRWGGFAAPLSAALEAEAREDEARTQRLTVPFNEAALVRGGEEDVWRLKGISVETLRALDDGEWLEILDDQGRSRANARVIDSHPSGGSLTIGVRAASDPPRSGYVRPRSRNKILEQKRALLEELASPTGSLPNLVRLVAAPGSMPTPRAERPPRFVNPNIIRNRSQGRAVALALGLEDGEALLIQGPPGTGKSTTAAEIDVQLILRDPGVRILVCSHSNHGTDNMLMKVLPFLDDAEERIARVGFYERIAKEARPFFATADTDLGEKNIVFTTIDALVLQDVAGARVYDYVILDEANRAGVLDSLLALARGRRMVLVGDPMQLQPVMSEAEQQMVAAAANGSARRGGGRHAKPALIGVAQPGEQNVIGKSLFAWIQERHFAPGASVLLDQQNRMHPAIGELVSRVFYSNRVRTGPAAPRRGTGVPAFPSPVSWVDTRSLRGNVESRAGGTSLFNLAEARLVTSITRHLASHAPPSLTMGVITAYSEQREVLRRMMGPHDWPEDRQLEIDTVDAFEGREKDIIILSLVRANRRRDIGFLRLEQRLNVAVSRSRRLLIIVGDTSTLRAGFFQHLVATSQSVGQIIPAPKLIGQFLQRGGGAGERRPRREREERRRAGALGVDGRATGELAAFEADELADLDADAAELAALDADASAELADFDADAAGELAALVAEREEAGDGRRPRGPVGAFDRDRRARERTGAGDAGSQAAGDTGAGAPAGRGQEGLGTTGSRRRRRRAWERRRDRLRVQHEDQAGLAAGGRPEQDAADWQSVALEDQAAAEWQSSVSEGANIADSRTGVSAADQTAADWHVGASGDRSAAHRQVGAPADLSAADGRQASASAGSNAADRQAAGVGEDRTAARARRLSRRGAGLSARAGADGDMAGDAETEAGVFGERSPNVGQGDAAPVFRVRRRRRRAGSAPRGETVRPAELGAQGDQPTRLELASQPEGSAQPQTGEAAPRTEPALAAPPTRVIQEVLEPERSAPTPRRRTPRMVPSTPASSPEPQPASASESSTRLPSSTPARPSTRTPGPMSTRRRTPAPATAAEVPGESASASELPIERALEVAAPAARTRRTPRSPRAARSAEPASANELGDDPIMIAPEGAGRQEPPPVRTSRARAARRSTPADNAAHPAGAVTLALPEPEPVIGGTAAGRPARVGPAPAEVSHPSHEANAGAEAEAGAGAIQPRPSPIAASRGPARRRRAGSVEEAPSRLAVASAAREAQPQPADADQPDATAAESLPRRRGRAPRPAAAAAGTSDSSAARTVASTRAAPGASDSSSTRLASTEAAEAPAQLPSGPALSRVARGRARREAAPDANATNASDLSHAAADEPAQGVAEPASAPTAVSATQRIRARRSSAASAEGSSTGSAAHTGGDAKAQALAEPAPGSAAVSVSRRGRAGRSSDAGPDGGGGAATVDRSVDAKARALSPTSSSSAGTAHGEPQALAEPAPGSAAVSASRRGRAGRSSDARPDGGGGAPAADVGGDARARAPASRPRRARRAADAGSDGSNGSSVADPVVVGRTPPAAPRAASLAGTRGGSSDGSSEPFPQDALANGEAALAQPAASAARRGRARRVPDAATDGSNVMLATDGAGQAAAESASSAPRRGRPKRSTGGSSKGNGQLMPGDATADDARR